MANKRKNRSETRPVLIVASREWVDARFKQIKYPEKCGDIKFEKAQYEYDGNLTLSASSPEARYAWPSMRKPDGQR